MSNFQKAETILEILCFCSIKVFMVWVFFHYFSVCDDKKLYFKGKVYKIIMFCTYIAMISNEIKQKLSNKYYCEKCDYGTDRKSNIYNHNMSAKHTLAMVSNDIKQKLSKN
jgi:hypothetical protein